MENFTPEEFLAAAQEYRSWSEERMEEELGRLAAERDCDLELTEQDDGWHAALVKDDNLLGSGRIILAESNAESGTRHEAMENLLLTLRFA